METIDFEDNPWNSPKLPKVLLIKIGKTVVYRGAYCPIRNIPHGIGVGYDPKSGKEKYVVLFENGFVKKEYIRFFNGLMHEMGENNEVTYIGFYTGSYWESYRKHGIGFVFDSSKGVFSLSYWNNGVNTQGVLDRVLMDLSNSPTLDPSSTTKDRQREESRESMSRDSLSSPQIQTLHQSLAAANRAIGDREKEMNEMRQQYHSQVQLNEKLNAELDDLRYLGLLSLSHERQGSNSRDGRDEKVRELEHRNTQLEESNRELKSQLQASEEIIQKLNEQHDVDRTERSDLSGNVSALTEQIQKYKNQLKEMTQARDEMSRELEAQKRKNKNAGNSSQTRNGFILDEDSKEQMNRILDERDMLLKECQEIKEKYNHLRALSVGNNPAHQSLLAKNEALQTRCKMLENELIQLKMEESPLMNVSSQKPKSIPKDNRLGGVSDERNNHDRLHGMDGQSGEQLRDKKDHPLFNFFNPTSHVVCVNENGSRLFQSLTSFEMNHLEDVHSFVVNSAMSFPNATKFEMHDCPYLSTIQIGGANSFALVNQLLMYDLSRLESVTISADGAFWMVNYVEFSGFPSVSSITISGSGSFSTSQSLSIKDMNKLSKLSISGQGAFKATSELFLIDLPSLEIAQFTGESCLRNEDNIRPGEMVLNNLPKLRFIQFGKYSENLCPFFYFQKVHCSGSKLPKSILSNLKEYLENSSWYSHNLKYQ